MSKLNLLLVILFCVAISACTQKELKLEANTLNDTICLGESLNIHLSLKKIAEQKNQDLDELRINDFVKCIKVKPDSLGKNILGPYKINLLGKEYQSNKVIVQVVKNTTADSLGDDNQINLLCKESKSDEVIIQIVKKAKPDSMGEDVLGSFKINLLDKEESKSDEVTIQIVKQAKPESSEEKSKSNEEINQIDKQAESDSLVKKNMSNEEAIQVEKKTKADSLIEEYNSNEENIQSEKQTQPDSLSEEYKLNEENIQIDKQSQPDSLTKNILGLCNIDQLDKEYKYSKWTIQSKNQIEPDSLNENILGPCNNLLADDYNSSEEIIQLEKQTKLDSLVEECKSNEELVQVVKQIKPDSLIEEFKSIEEIIEALQQGKSDSLAKEYKSNEQIVEDIKQAKPDSLIEEYKFNEQIAQDAKQVIPDSLIEEYKSIDKQTQPDSLIKNILGLCNIDQLNQEYKYNEWTVQIEKQTKSDSLNENILGPCSNLLASNCKSNEEIIQLEKQSQPDSLNEKFESTEGIIQLVKETVENILDPSKIDLLNTESKSNEEVVRDEEDHADNIHIKIPKKAIVGEKVEIKIKGLSDQDYSFHLKENEIFTIKGQSQSSQKIDEKYSNKATFTVVLKKKGIFEFTRDLFKDLPDHIKLDSVQFEVE